MNKDELVKKLDKRFRRKPTKKLYIKLRDRKGKLVKKLIVENMYGNRYSLEVSMNKGKTKMTLIIMDKLDKVADQIIIQRNSVKNKIASKFKNIL